MLYLQLYLAKILSQSDIFDGSLSIDPHVAIERLTEAEALSRDSVAKLAENFGKCYFSSLDCLQIRARILEQLGPDRAEEAKNLRKEYESRVRSTDAGTGSMLWRLKAKLFAIL